VLDGQGKYPEALEYYNKSLEIMIKVHGQDHPIAADTLYNIALVHREQGRHDLEAECFDKCVVIYGKVHGDAHSETVDAREQAARARA
jgi:tetratricopeptide (TPR) repeat protein